jgi:3',5'-cyclic-AMP phosphodiesterase
MIHVHGGNRVTFEAAMKILAVEPEPFHVFPYHVSSGLHPLIALLPFYRAIVDGLPEGLDVIIATGDLQGTEQTSDSSRSSRLLGEVLASEIKVLRTRGLLPSADRTAAVLAGDFQPRADEGDIRAVWFALADVCRWVAGVAGNHDTFGSDGSAWNVLFATDRSELHFFDENTTTLDGLKIGGISGIVGTQIGRWIRTESEFAAAISRLANRGLDLLISHDGPNVAGTALTGWPSIRQALESAQPTILVRGHDFWASPLAILNNGTQILNVDERVVVMCRGAGNRTSAI